MCRSNTTKMLKTTIRPLTFVLLLVALIGCNQNKQKTSSASVPADATVPDTPGTMPAKEPVISEDSAVFKLNRTILLLLKSKDYAGLAKYIHQDRGVRFSPYGYVDTVRHQQFSVERFKKEMNANKEINWGQYDGSGDTILLSCKAYFLKFVYNKDFVNSEKTSLNKMVGSGNSLNNLEAVYVGLPYVESYFSGFDKKYAGMDWCSLRLVFEKMGEHYFLVGVVHDQWTI